MISSFPKGVSLPAPIFFKKTILPILKMIFSLFFIIFHTFRNIFYDFWNYHSEKCVLEIIISNDFLYSRFSILKISFFFIEHHYFEITQTC